MFESAAPAAGPQQGCQPGVIGRARLILFHKNSTSNRAVWRVCNEGNFQWRMHILSITMFPDRPMAWSIFPISTTNDVFACLWLFLDVFGASVCHGQIICFSCFFTYYACFGGDLTPEKVKPGHDKVSYEKNLLLRLQAVSQWLESGEAGWSWMMLCIYDHICVYQRSALICWLHVLIFNAGRSSWRAQDVCTRSDASQERQRHARHALFGAILYLTEISWNYR